MANYTRIEVINSIYERGLIPRVHIRDHKAIIDLLTALVDGGARVIELRISESQDIKVISDLIPHAKQNDLMLTLGAGMVDDPGTAVSYMDMGADFLSGSMFDPEVARVCNQRKVLYIPTCNDLAETNAAEEMGAELVKVEGKDPAFIKNIMEQKSWSRIMPTLVENPDPGALKPWVEAGAACLSMDVETIKKEAASSQDWPALTAAIEACMWAIAQARGNPLFSGVEHVGLYPKEGQEAREIAQWYAQMFGFHLDEGETYFFARSTGPGRIEILKDSEPLKAHVAIKVRNFQAGCETLRGRGIDLEPPKLLGRIKAVFLKERDPAGNKVHLIYQAI
jgi:2-dehydro-3-deoxyphosphogluconate aldolase/(4S)-4-hydroxy-2-oxoglutarate aldolase